MGTVFHGGGLLQVVVRQERAAAGMHDLGQAFTANIPTVSRMSARLPDEPRQSIGSGFGERLVSQIYPLRRVMCNSGQQRRSPDRMLHQTVSKGWCSDGSGLLLGLIV